MQSHQEQNSSINPALVFLIIKHIKMQNKNRLEEYIIRGPSDPSQQFEALFEACKSLCTKQILRVILGQGFYRLLVCNLCWKSKKISKEMVEEEAAQIDQGMVVEFEDTAKKLYDAEDKQLLKEYFKVAPYSVAEVQQTPTSEAMYTIDEDLLSHFQVVVLDDSLADYMPSLFQGTMTLKDGVLKGAPSISKRSKTSSASDEEENEPSQMQQSTKRRRRISSYTSSPEVDHQNTGLDEDEVESEEEQDAAAKAREDAAAKAKQAEAVEAEIDV